MSGDIVLVRDFEGKLVKLRVWHVRGSVVFVTNDENYRRLVAGKPAFEPIAFPKADIFQMPATLSSEMLVNPSNLVPWSDERPA